MIWVEIHKFFLVFLIFMVSQPFSKSRTRKLKNKNKQTPQLWGKNLFKITLTHSFLIESPNDLNILELIAGQKKSKATGKSSWEFYLSVAG